MMYPKPKSAPGRFVQSKFVKNRTNAMKEMEAWVRKDDNPGSAHEASRMSGQLTDNVTEERMLRAKLWELSKERYKFLSQNAYEKKIFTDRMQRKSSALLRRPSGSAREDVESAAGVNPARQRWRHARKAVQAQTKRPKDSPSGNKDREKAGSKAGSRRKGSLVGGARGRVTPAATPITISPAGGPGIGGGKVILAPLPLKSPVASPQTLPSASAEDPKPPGSNPDPTHDPAPTPLQPNPRNVKFDKAQRPGDLSIRSSGGGATEAELQTSTRHASPRMGPRPRQSPGGNSIPSPGVFPTRPLSVSGQSSKPASASSVRSKPWALTAATPIMSPVGGVPGGRGRGAGRFGLRVESTTTDPRYAQLASSLSPMQGPGQTGSDVGRIVSSLEALHLPPRRRKETKPRTELKALEYIEEQGFVFLNNGQSQ